MKYYNAEMETVHPSGYSVMTWEDAEEVEKLNYENGWGFSSTNLLRLIADHEDCYFDMEETTDMNTFHKYMRKMERIEWRLEDANFHELHKLLRKHEYRKAVEWLLNNIYEGRD